MGDQLKLDVCGLAGWGRHRNSEYLTVLGWVLVESNTKILQQSLNLTRNSLWWWRVSLSQLLHYTLENLLCMILGQFIFNYVYLRLGHVERGDTFLRSAGVRHKFSHTHFVIFLVKRRHYACIIVDLCRDVPTSRAIFFRLTWLLYSSIARCIIIIEELVVYCIGSFACGFSFRLIDSVASRRAWPCLNPTINSY